MSEDRTTGGDDTARRAAAAARADEPADARLDGLVAALAAARPVLDDVARARVGAKLAATTRRWAVGSAVRSEPDERIGQRLCGYEVVRRLAEGGTSAVYEAIHGETGQRVAIKLVQPEIALAADAIERFRALIGAVRALGDDHLVALHAVGPAPGGGVCVVMEALDGESLAARIRRGALGWAEARPILDQALRALEAAHGLGVIHRRLAPDKLWLTEVDGQLRVKLLDVGIAQLVSEEVGMASRTQPRQPLGPAYYLAPEQIDGRGALDHRADLYALGVIAHEMVSGAPPFTGDTAQAVLAGHLYAPPPRLLASPAVPAQLAELVDCLLAKAAGDRYASAASARADLRELDRRQAPANARRLAAVRPRRRARRLRRLAVVLAVVLAAGLAARAALGSRAARPAAASPAPADR